MSIGPSLCIVFICTLNLLVFSFQLDDFLNFFALLDLGAGYLQLSTYFQSLWNLHKCLFIELNTMFYFPVHWMASSMTVPAARMPANATSVHVQASAEHNFVSAPGKFSPHILNAGEWHQICLCLSFCLKKQLYTIKNLIILPVCPAHFF